SSAGRSAAGGSPLAGFASEGSPWAGPAAGESRSAGAPGRAALFLGCAQEGLFPEANRAAEALLRRAGFAVEISAGQGCCGALHRHNRTEEGRVGKVYIVLCRALQNRCVVDNALYSDDDN